MADGKTVDVRQHASSTLSEVKSISAFISSAVIFVRSVALRVVFNVTAHVVSTLHDLCTLVCDVVSDNENEATMPCSSSLSRTRGVVSVLGPSSKVRAITFP